MSNSRPATIKDIARIPGLHHSTISRALRDSPGVDALTSKRVLAAANGIKAAKCFLELHPRPDAIFTVDDRVALGLMIHRRQKGVAVPEEVALVGFDNDPMAGLMQPALTTVA